MLEMPILPDLIPAPGGLQSWRMTFLSGELNTRAALRAVDSTLTQAGLSAEDRENAEIVLAEVLNNITEHAYRGSSGPVELCMMLTTGALDCTLRDRGKPMPGGVPPEGKVPQPDCPFEALPEGGFGWFIIHHLTRDLTLKSQDGWNVLSFALPLAEEPS